MGLSGQTVGERIALYAKEHKGWNLARLARELKVSNETLRKWKTGETAPNRNRSVQIAEKLGVTVEFVTHGSLPADDRLTETTDIVGLGGKAGPRLAGSVVVALLNAGASMGDGGLHAPDHEDVVTTLTVREEWLRRNASFSSPENLSLLTGFGDSMVPTFHDGDVLMVDRGVNDVRVDGVYALALEDELFIKRLQRRIDGTMLMISDNPSYPPQTITDRNHMRVVGRVVMAWNARRL